MKDERAEHTQLRPPASKPLRIWVIQVGEPLPTDPGQPRLHRSLQLANELADRGHDVRVWSSNFHYAHKTFRPFGEEPIAVRDGLEIVHVASPGYQRNISFKRIWNEQVVATNLRRLIDAAPPPDIIHCGYPSVETAHVVVKYAAARGLPVVVDVRDMWPDVFLDHVPAAARAFARPVIKMMSMKAAAALRGATAITGHTEPFVEFGLRKARRARQAVDRAFPFSYEKVVDESLSDDELATDLTGMARTEPAIRVCFFGNLDTARCDVDLVTPLVALDRLTETQRSHIQMIICGEGRLAQRVRALSAHLPNVSIPGWVNSATIRHLMRRSDLGLLPYLPSADFTQSIPNKAVEYLAGGLPILTSLSSGVLADTLRPRNAGIFYGQAAAEQLATSLAALLERPSQLDALKANASRLFDDVFDARKVLPAMAEHLEALAVRKR